MTFLLDLEFIKSLSSGPSQFFPYILVHKDTRPISLKIYTAGQIVLYINFEKFF